MIKYEVSNQGYYYQKSNEKSYKNYKYWKILYYNENRELHRLDGPAIIDSDGTKIWCKNNLYHREDGLAVESIVGNEYYYYGRKIFASSDKEFNKFIFKIKMKLFK
jgi:hypothetical protein